MLTTSNNHLHVSWQVKLATVISSLMCGMSLECLIRILLKLKVSSQVCILNNFFLPMFGWGSGPAGGSGLGLGAHGPMVSQLDSVQYVQHGAQAGVAVPCSQARHFTLAMPFSTQECNGTGQFVRAT